MTGGWGRLGVLLWCVCVSLGAGIIGGEGRAVGISVCLRFGKPKPKILNPSCGDLSH